MKYQGSCHCGAISFEVEGALKEAMSCNCSICQRKGSLLWFVQPEAFQLRTPPERVATYTFNKHVVQHHFCSSCGMHPYGEGADPSGAPVVAVNIRCLEGIDLNAVPVEYFNGRAL